jgi:hypothetical protein
MPACAIFTAGLLWFRLLLTLLTASNQADAIVEFLKLQGQDLPRQ